MLKYVIMCIRRACALYKKAHKKHIALKEARHGIQNIGLH